MIRVTEEKGELRLIFKDTVVLAHTKDNPFAAQFDWKLKYKAKRGSFEIKGSQSGWRPLNNARCESKGERKAKLVFSGNKVKLTVDVAEKDGALSLNFSSDTKSAWFFRLPSNKNEAFFGGGEQFRKLNLKGETVENFVSEHIALAPIIRKTIFSFVKYKPHPHKDIKTYSPMSTFVSSGLYAVRFDTDEYGTADFTSDNSAVFKFLKLPKSMLYVKADTYEDISKRLAEDIKNNQYLPDWCHDGMIIGVQGGIDRASEKAETMLKAGAAVNGVWCQDWSGRKITIAGKQVYWNWEADLKHYADLKERVAELKEKGVAFLAYINPYLIENGKMYNECRDNGLLIKNKKGGIYHIMTTTFKAGMFDLTNPRTVKYIKETVIKENILSLGIRGYMADFGEYLPIDCLLFDGDPKKCHNLWPVLWAKINRDAVREAGKEHEVMFFTRSGYNGAQKYTPIMWNGDQHTDYTPDYGLQCVMPASFNLGFSGLTMVHSDVGGYISFKNLKRDDELFIRWMEMNTFSPLMRSHETVRPETNSQYDSPAVLPHFIRLSNIHKALKPYTIACFAEAQSGIPAITPDFYYSNDYGKHKDMYSYYFGRDIFVAPVTEKGVVTREVNLPEGEWIHLFTKSEYGGGQVTVGAPLGQPAVFYKKDSRFAELFGAIATDAERTVNAAR